MSQLATMNTTTPTGFASRFESLARSNPTAASAVAQAFRDRTQNVAFGFRRPEDGEVGKALTHTVGALGGGALTGFYDRKAFLTYTTFLSYAAQATGSDAITTADLRSTFEKSFTDKTLNDKIQACARATSTADVKVTYPEVGMLAHPSGFFGGLIPYAGLIALAARLVPHAFEPESNQDADVLGYFDAAGQGVWDGFVGGLGYRLVLQRNATVLVQEDKA